MNATRNLLDVITNNRPKPNVIPFQVFVRSDAFLGELRHPQRVFPWNIEDGANATRGWFHSWDRSIHYLQQYATALKN